MQTVKVSEGGTSIKARTGLANDFGKSEFCLGYISSLVCSEDRQDTLSQAWILLSLLVFEDTVVHIQGEDYFFI